MGVAQIAMFPEPARVKPRAGLRYYQLEAVAAVFEAWNTHRRVLLNMATGTGKTVIFAEIAREFHGRVLVLAHRDELISQTLDQLVITTGERIGLEQAEFYSEKERIVVGSVQTVYRKDRYTRLQQLGGFDMVILDECFPAGTLIDGKPIEDIKVGDEVWSVDHATGTVAPRPVVRTFRKVTRDPLVVLHIGATTIKCTGNHPVFVKGRGYVHARNLLPGDMLCMRQDVPDDTCATGPDTDDMLEEVSVYDLLGSYGEDEPQVRIEADEEKQSDAQPRGTSEGGSDAESDRAQAEGSGRKWNWAPIIRVYVALLPRKEVEVALHRGDRKKAPVAEPLRAGPSAPGERGLRRGGRAVSQHTGEKEVGQAQRQVFAWVRLDGVARDEQAGARGTVVYNIEVQGAHTYFANDVLVHNCHHYVAKTYRRAVEAFPNACVLGVTATPDRGDKKALGQILDHCAYRFDILAGIDAGYLVPLEGHHVTIDAIDLRKVRTVAGDLNKSELDDAVCEGVEGIVKAVLDRWPDRKAVAFFPKKRSARLACERFNFYRPGIAGVVDDDTPRDERRDIIARCRSGDIQILCNCLIATEGFDWPEASLIINARPTKSRGLYTQIVGRGTRVLPRTVDSVLGEDGAGQRRGFIADSDKPLCVIADFVGNAGKHDLRSPIDVLAGNYDEAVVKVAKRLAKEEGAGDPIDQLERAQLEIKAMAASMRESAVRHSSRGFNPFAVMHMDEMPESWRDDRAISDRQGSYLLRYMKFTPDDLRKLSFREAQQLIKTAESRRRAGLASFGQLKQLQRYGIEQVNISRDRATQAMEYLKDNGWGRGQGFNRDRLRAIALASHEVRPR